MELKSLNAYDGWLIWKKSWEFSKPHWFNLFIITVSAVLITIFCSLIPIFGPALSTVVTGILSFGLMCVTSEIRKNNKVDFKILFAGFENGVFQRLYNLIFIWFMLGLAQGLVSFFFRGLPYGMILSTVVSLLITAAIISFIIFAPALIIWYDKPYKEAINLNFEAAKINKASLTVYTLAPGVLAFSPVLLMLIAQTILPQIGAAIFSVVLLIAMFALMIVFAPAIVASLYFLFEAIFLGVPLEEHQPPQQLEPPQ